MRTPAAVVCITVFILEGVGFALIFSFFPPGALTCVGDGFPAGSSMVVRTPAAVICITVFVLEGVGFALILPRGTDLRQ